MTTDQPHRVWDAARHCVSRPPPAAGEMGVRGPGCICKLLTASRRQAGSRGLERACRSRLGIYYPASGCRAKVTVTNGLLHACHISSAHRGRLPALPALVCKQPVPALPSLGGGNRGETLLVPHRDLIRAGDGDGLVQESIPILRMESQPCIPPSALPACAMARQSRAVIPWVPLRMGSSQPVAHPGASLPALRDAQG